MKGKTIAVWFSCGAASAVAAKLIVEMYGKANNVIVFNNPVAEEDSDNRRFLNDVSQWLGQGIVLASNPDFPSNSCQEVWEKKKYMSNRFGAPCTKFLKKEARYQFEKNHKIDWHVLGFPVEEKDRHERFIKFERDNVIPILIDENLTKGDCFEMIEAAGIELPRIYKLGFPNANCVGCVKASSPTYWNHVRKTFPEVFKQRAELSRLIGARLVKYKGKRMFLDELPTDATGRKMKSWECGIFCEIPKVA